MANPLFKALGGGVPMNNNFMNMMNQFNQFRRNFQGNPKQTVMQMVNSGQISQSQLNQVQQMANEFQRIMGGMK